MFSDLYVGVNIIFSTAPEALKAILLGCNTRICSKDIAALCVKWNWLANVSKTRALFSGMEYLKATLCHAEIRIDLV